jgi:hypothetical protein
MAETIWKTFRTGQIYVPNKEEREFHGERPKLFYGFGKVKADEMLREHCHEVLANADNLEKISSAYNVLFKGIGVFHYLIFLENLKNSELNPFFYSKIDEHNLAKTTLLGGLKVKRAAWDRTDGFKSTAVFSKKEYKEIRDCLQLV